MTEAKKRLGRGLNSLLSSTRMQEMEENTTVTITPVPVSETSNVSIDKIMELSVEKIQKNPHQPRQNWDEAKLLDLSESIKTSGVIQPVLVRQMGQGYQLIAGERRLRATRLAGKDKIPAIVKQVSEEQVIEWALIENLHRADLNPLERARAYQHYLNNFSMTQQEAAVRLSEDRSTIANYIRLLELPAEIQKMLTEGSLSMGHARAILSVTDNKKKMELAEMVKRKNISVRELERKIHTINKNGDEKKPKEEKSANVLELEREFTRNVGTKVTIKTVGKRKQRGKIIIEYYSLDDFDRIKEKLI